MRGIAILVTVNGLVQETVINRIAAASFRFKRENLVMSVDVGLQLGQTVIFVMYRGVVFGISVVKFL